MTIRTPAGEHLYHAPQASVAFPRAGTISGPIVFAGFGITAPELGYDDYAGIDAKGKIVLIFDHEPQESDAKSIFSGKGNTRYAGSFVKVRTAQEHGAVAVLLMPEPNRQHPSNEDRRNRMGATTTQRVSRLPAQALEDSELKIPLDSRLESIGNDIAVGCRADKRPSFMQISHRSRSETSLTDLPGSTASIQIALASSRKATSYNVVGLLLEGSDPKLKEETVVISAHYDHDGPTGDGGMFPGRR